MKPGIILLLAFLIPILLFGSRIIYVLKFHPERTYAYQCRPLGFVKMFEVNRKTYAICAPRDANKAEDFLVKEMQ